MSFRDRSLEFLHKAEDPIEIRMILNSKRRLSPIHCGFLAAPVFIKRTGRGTLPISMRPAGS